MSSYSDQRFWRALGALSKASNTQGQEQIDSAAEALEILLALLREGAAPTDPALCAERDEAIALATQALAKATGAA